MKPTARGSSIHRGWGSEHLVYCPHQGCADRRLASACVAHAQTIPLRSRLDSFKKRNYFVLDNIIIIT